MPIILLQLLDADKALSMVASSAVQQLSQSYLSDPACVEAISHALSSAAEYESPICGPAMIAWAAIGRELFIQIDHEDVDGIDRRDSLSVPAQPRPRRSAPHPAWVTAWRA